MPRTLHILLLALLALPLGAQSEVRISFGSQSLRLHEQEGLLSFGYRDEVARDRLLERLGEFQAELREDLVERRVAIVSVPPRYLERALGFIRSLRAIRHAHPVYGLAPTSDRESWYLLTDHLVVYFRGAPGVNRIQARLDEVGARLVKPLRWLPGAYLLRVRRQDSALRAVAELREMKDVIWAHVDWLRHLGSRQSIPNDPLFANLWHLRNTGQGGGLVGADIKATEAWDHVQGQGMTIAVIDTGVAPHPDITLGPEGYDVLAGYGPGMGADQTGHGTSVAGVAAATGDNGQLVCGIAYGATVLPVRLITGSGFGTPTDEAGCFIWSTDNGADVITNSWGPDGIPFPLPPIVQSAFGYATTIGRNGKGCPIFWAAGNGNEPIVLDEYVGSPFTIAVGASTNLDGRASYSDYGPELDFLAPSSGGTRGINTLTHTGGTTLLFGGTSASAPLAAGVGALVIEAAPQLSWTQVRDVLRASCERIQPATASYSSSGHSIYFGYGRLDAEQAVDDALATLVPPLSLSVTTSGGGDIIVDLQNMGPYHEWAIGFSGEVHIPVGSGPLFGVGWDALQTFLMPAGTIPFHAWADVHGRFHWGTWGVPAGIVLQAVAIEVTYDGSWRLSNVTHTAF